MARRGDRFTTPDVTRTYHLEPFRRNPVLVTRTHVLRVEDRRHWSPVPRSWRPAGATSRDARRLVLRDVPNKPGLLPHQVSFRVPDKVAICVRRKVRKEVMFATKKAGRGGAKARHRRNAWSDVKC